MSRRTVFLLATLQQGKLTRCKVLPPQIIANQLRSDRVIFRRYLVGMSPAEQARLFSPAFLLSLHRHWLGMKHPAVADCWNGIQTQWLNFSLSAKYLPIGECPLPRLRGIVEKVSGQVLVVVFEDKNKHRGKQPEGIFSFFFKSVSFSLLCPGEMH